MIWKRICCAVDFSEPSWIAMEQAADLAGALRAGLTLVPAPVPVLVVRDHLRVVHDRDREESAQYA